MKAIKIELTKSQLEKLRPIYKAAKEHIEKVPINSFVLTVGYVIFKDMAVKFNPKPSKDFFECKLIIGKPAKQIQEYINKKFAKTKHGGK